MTIAATNPALVGTFNIATRPYFKKAMTDGNAVISEAFDSGASHYPIVVLASPIRADGQIRGLLCATVNLSKFYETFLSTIHPAGTGYAYLMNDKCIAIAHPDSSNILRTNVCDLGFGGEMLARKQGVIHYTFKGSAKSAAFATDDLTGWLLAVTLNDDDVVRGAAKARSISLFLGVLLAGIGVFVALWIGHLVTLQLGKDPEDLSSVAVEMASGNLNPEMDENVRHGVYGALAKMVLSLRRKESLARTIASGDLTENVDLTSEKDALGHALGQMTEGLRKIVTYINAAGIELQANAEELSSASETLSQGSIEQAASLEEISSSIAEISAQTKSNAENASQANNLAQSSSENAARGYAEVQSSVLAMQGITNASTEISKIIKVIDDIAFQTNLLALNAAVEAARAGQYGKGFAVVADEVRNLASRSSQAAKETTDLIDDAGKKIESGIAAVQHTAKSFEAILSSAQKVADLLSKISIATNEQAQGIAQVSKALMEIDQVTQQTTANAEQTASTAEELAHQATEFNRMLGQFRLRKVQQHLKLADAHLDNPLPYHKEKIAV